MVRTDFGARALPWAQLALERGGLGAELNAGWRHRLGAVAALGALVASLARRPRLAVGGAAAMALIHLPFFSLLARRGGAGLVGAGMLLHLLHHLTAIAALPVALVSHALGRAEGRG
jgi:hypothetical protein